MTALYDFNIETNEGIELMMNSYNLLNMIADYNQSMIREEKNNTPTLMLEVVDNSNLNKVLYEEVFNSIVIFFFITYWM